MTVASHLERCELLGGSAAVLELGPAPGNILDRGPEEFYVSSPIQLPAGCRVSQVAWDAELAPHTWVRAQLRCATHRDQLLSAPWVGPDVGDGWYRNHDRVSETDQATPWVQFRLAVGAVNGCGTPRISAVHLQWEKV